MSLRDPSDYPIKENWRTFSSRAEHEAWLEEDARERAENAASIAAMDSAIKKADATPRSISVPGEDVEILRLRGEVLELTNEVRRLQGENAELKARLASPPAFPHKRPGRPRKQELVEEE